eukprot:scaffold92629_cov60-Phaeocystis_antarctica.AAC.1
MFWRFGGAAAAGPPGRFWFDILVAAHRSCAESSSAPRQEVKLGGPLVARPFGVGGGSVTRSCDAKRRKLG